MTGTSRSIDILDTLLAGAICAEEPIDVFFPYHSKNVAAAIEICNQCPVIETCLEFAMSLEGTRGRDMRFGVFGGLTPTERARLSRARCAA